MVTEAEKPSQKSPASDSNDRLRVIVGDELGQLRVCEASKTQISSLNLNQSWGQADRKRGIEHIAVSPATPGEPSAYIATSLADGCLEVRSTASGEILETIEASTSGREEGGDSLKAVHFIHLDSKDNGDRVLALASCTSSGFVRIHRKRTKPELLPSWEMTSSWQGPANVLATAVDESNLYLAFACKGSELSIWDIAMGERIYLAKGAKPNRIGLMDKPWNTAVAFLPGSNGSQLIVGTGQHKVMVYKTSQRRPVLSVDFGEARITALAPQLNGQKCWIADSQGQIGCLDLNLGKVQQMLKGSAGSVRSLVIQPDLNVIISAGLDRYLRIHDLTSRKPIARLFLKHHLVGAVVPQAALPKLKIPDENGEKNSSEAQEGSLKQTKMKKKKKKRNGEDSNLKKKAKRDVPKED